MADDVIRPHRIVDTHVHFWDPARTEWYPYLAADEGSAGSTYGRAVRDLLGDVSGMARRFDPAIHAAESAGWNVEKVVNVAAATGAHSVEETLEVQRMADALGSPHALIGGLPPGDDVADAVAALDRQMAASRFRGVRPMGRRMSDPLPADEVLAALAERGLIFEAMAQPDTLPAVAEAVGAHEGLTVVVEHTGWPRSADAEEHRLWRRGIDALADLGPRVVCKVSGLAQPLAAMSAEAYRPWVDHVLEAFGPDRCMVGSNFPVDGLHGTLDELWSTYAALTAHLDDDARDLFFAGTAERVYRL
jgi:predicted TIM-barrel fold metal-dependent hydrolase